MRPRGAWCESYVPPDIVDTEPAFAWLTIRSRLRYYTERTLPPDNLNAAGGTRDAHNGTEHLAGDAIHPDNSVSGVRQPDGAISHGLGSVRKVESAFRGSQRREQLTR